MVGFGFRPIASIERTQFVVRRRQCSLVRKRTVPIGVDGDRRDRHQVINIEFAPAELRVVDADNGRGVFGEEPPDLAFDVAGDRRQVDKDLSVL